MDQLILQRQKYGAGDHIFKEGDEGRLAYVVEEGEVEIFMIIDDHEQVLGTVGKDGIFGEMALIDNQPRMANARATKTTTIICVTRQMFDEKLNRADPFIRGLLKILADNNRDITSKWLMALH
jgi:CRP/FNR family cyclic AMP-dependent transcriptional regulator|tara:strand:+ start:1073 stop:1441 length:369 start_codon:yes stop_codon:yes gene_type:complete